MIGCGLRLLAGMLVIGGLFLGLMTTTLWTDAGERIHADAASYRDFQAVANRAKQLVRRTGHPLTDAEKGMLVKRGNSYPYIGFDAYDPADRAFVRSLGPVPQGEFILSFWRGEWFEYYASWSGETSLLTTRERYWRAFGKDAIVSGILAAILLTLGLWLTRRMARGEVNEETA